MRKQITQVTDLEIFKSATDLLGVVIDLLPHFPSSMKDVRVALLQHCIGIQVAVPIANDERGKEKIPFIRELLRHLYAVRFLLRIAAEKKWITPDQHGRTLPLTVSIKNQAYGWKKFSAS